MTGDAIEAQKSVKHYLTVIKLVNEDIGVKPDEQDGVLIRWSSFKMVFLNVLSFQDHNVNQDELRKRLRFGSDFMRKEMYTGMFCLFEDLISKDALANLDETMKDFNLFHAETSFGMRGDISNIQDTYHPELIFKHVQTQKELDDYGIINARAHDIPQEPFLKYLKLSPLWKDIGQKWVGYNKDNGGPVCSAGSYPINESIYLVGIATEKGYLKPGYAEVISRKALYEGKKQFGLNKSILTSTPAARRLYERMGFRVRCTISILMLEGL